MLVLKKGDVIARRLREMKSVRSCWEVKSFSVSSFGAFWFGNICVETSSIGAKINRLGESQKLKRSARFLATSARWMLKRWAFSPKPEVVQSDEKHEALASSAQFLTIFYQEALLGLESCRWWAAKIMLSCKSTNLASKTESWGWKQRWKK